MNPPVIANGRRLSENRPVPGTTVSYECNEGYFAFGPNSANLQTTCLDDRSYTLGAEDLATCVRIGLFMFIEYYQKIKKSFECSP